MEISFSLNNGHGEHQFIQTTGKPLHGAVTEASVLLANQYLKRDLSAKKWREIKDVLRINYEYPVGQKKTSSPINYLKISEYIREKGRFDIAAFNLPELECMWLDHSTEMKQDFHMHDHTGTLGVSSGDIQKYYYGESYPVKPILQREGRLYTSFQPHLIKRIMDDRNKLITESSKALTDDWVFDLRNLINNTISVLDVSFTQLYIKAQYDPMPGWKFDRDILGARHGKRLDDKFKWVYQITGIMLNIESEREDYKCLKDLRNHLMHFDPPSLVITIEEVALWLNQIISIGKILIKLRQVLKVEVPVQLVNFILQEEALFVPWIKGNRKPLGSDRKQDYFSSIWPSKE